VIDLFQKADAWILWFIGFSIGGLALFAGNLDKFSNRLTSDQVHQIFTKSFFAIISGVLFRYVYMWFYMHLMTNIFSRTAIDFDSKYDQPVYKKLEGNETFTELIIRVNTYTGENFNNLLLTFIEADEKKRIELCSILIDYYQKAEVFNSDDLTKGLDYVKERLQVYYGRPFEELKKKDNSFNRFFGKKFYLLVVLGSILLLVFTISFAVALYTFCFKIHM